MWNFIRSHPIPRKFEKLYTLIYKFVEVGFIISDFSADDVVNTIVVENAISDFIRNSNFEHWFTIVDQLFRDVMSYTIQGTIDVTVLRESYDTKNDVYLQINTLLINWFSQSHTEEKITKFRESIEKVRNMDDYCRIYIKNFMPSQDSSTSIDD
jgi:hypothetical protein